MNTQELRARVARLRLEELLGVTSGSDNNTCISLSLYIYIYIYIYVYMCIYIYIYIGSFSALLVGFRYLCWRSHRLFGELPNLEIRRALEMGEAL